MNHQFLPSYSDPNKCGQLTARNALCGHSTIAHSDEAECDHCDYVGRGVEIDANGDLACPKCLNLIIKKEVINTSQGPLRPEDILRTSRQIDSSVELVSDIFNLETVAITELVTAIKSDESITNKPSAIAATLFERIKHFQKVIFERSDENKKDYSRQRAYQSELNKIANELREEEREKYRLIDINYKPRPPKSDEIKIKKVSLKKKLDKVEVRNASKETGIPEYTIQAYLTAKTNLTPMQAALEVKQQMENARKLINGE